MDLRRYAAVLRRFWWAPALGLLVGGALAVVATFRLPGLDFRQAERSTSVARLFVTQADFPWGTVSPGGGTGSDTSARYADLAIVYSYLLQGAPVLRDVPLPAGAELSAQALRDGSGGNATALPFVEVTAVTRRPADAPLLAARAIDALRTYLRARQVQDDVPPTNRVVLQVIAPPAAPELTERRSYAGAVVALVLCGLLGALAAYAAEDLRRGARGRPVTPHDDRDPRGDPEPEPVRVGAGV